MTAAAMAMEDMKVRAWLAAEALALWSTTGVGHARGFFEKLGVDGSMQGSQVRIL